MKLQQGLTNGDRNPDDTEQLPAVEQPAFAGSNVKKSVDEQVSGGAQPTVSVGPAPSIPQALAATGNAYHPKVARIALLTCLQYRTKTSRIS